MRVQTLRGRRGAIVPLTALCLTGILAFVAMAIDLGVIMTMRNQCQNAADSAAMAGARTLNGNTAINNNYSNVLPEATVAVQANTIFNNAISASSQLVLSIGDYYYSSSTNSFQIDTNNLGNSGDNWTLVQATVTASQPSFFANVLGMPTLSAQAMATAAHRPRDIVVVIDFSGSMRFESLLGYPYSGSRTLSMNPDTVYPKFGFYSTSSNQAQLTYSSDQTASGGEDISECNVSYVGSSSTALANSTVISGFYGDSTAFGTSTPAFTAASSSYATTPAGDQPLTQNKNTGATAAYTVQDFLNSSSPQTSRDWRFELDGYAAYASGSANANVSGAPTTPAAISTATRKGPATGARPSSPGRPTRHPADDHLLHRQPDHEHRQAVPD